MRTLFRRVLDKFISTCITPSLLRQGLNADSLIGKASRFAACEVIEGDYLEFGVYEGASLITSFKSLRDAFESRSSQFENYDSHTNRIRKEVWNKMRFFAFDSFQGLPALEDDDAGTSDFKKGMYACNAETVRKNIARAGIPAKRTILIEGWFSETCNQITTKKHNISKACIIWIDGDLYSSTRDILRFIQDFLQDGTIIIFDDWFSYRGNPAMGEQRAFYEWKETAAIKNKFRFQEYARESWKRMSFIVSAI